MRPSSNLNCLKVAFAPGCTCAHAWRVTLELIESEYLWSPCGEQICLTPYVHFNTMVQSYFQLVISGKSKLDASTSKRLKTVVSIMSLLASFEVVDC